MSERDMDRDYAQVDTSPTEHEQEVAEVAEDGGAPAEERGGLLGGIAAAEDEPVRDAGGATSAHDLEADRRGDDESV